MYGVLFPAADLRRILTVMAFQVAAQGLSAAGYVELRYSEEEKRVKYQARAVAAGFRRLPFLSPWEGADYVLLVKKNRRERWQKVPRSG
jgi:hypothetical protein